MLLCLLMEGGGLPHSVLARGYPIPGLGGGYPIPGLGRGYPPPSRPVMGYPLSPGWGTPCLDLGWSTPCHLDGVPPISWIGYPLGLGTPCQLDWVAPTWTWDGYPPSPLDLGWGPPSAGWGTPPDLGWGTLTRT